MTNQDGEFLCHHHDRQIGRQWRLKIEFDNPCKCDKCNNQAAFYVLTKQDLHNPDTALQSRTLARADA